MIKIGIVEDEAIERKAISRLIMRYSSEVAEVVFEAANGLEAIQMAAYHKPDIILFDIQMPIVDGLEMAETLKKLLPDCEFAVMTAYGSFDYAQKALQIGVSDYIVKPYSDEQFHNLMNLLLEKVKIKHNDEIKIMMGNEQLKRFSSFMDRQILMDMITGASIDQFTDTCYSDHLNLNNNIYRCVVIRPARTGQPTERLLSAARIKLLSNGLRTVIGTIFSDNMVFIVAGKAEDKITNDNKFAMMVEKVKEHIEELARDTYIVAFSPIETSLQSLNRTYYDAKKEVGFKRYADTKRNEITRLYELEAILLERIFKLEHARVYEILNRLLILIMDIPEASKRRDSLKDLCFFIERNTHQAIENGSIGELVSNTIRQINETHDGGKIKNILNFFISECMVAIEQNNADKLKGLIDVVKKYVLSNVKNDISLEGIAEYVGMSPSYLSRQFKKIEQINFKDYIIKVRMELAKEYLLKGKYNVSEVAAAVGYTDSNYFSFAFKKYVGVPPKAFSRAYREKSNK